MGDFPCDDVLSSTLTYTESDLLDTLSGSNLIIDSATSGSIQANTTASDLESLANTRASSLKPTAPALTADTSTFTTDYINRINNLNGRIKTEYCYYYKRYYVAVRYFLDYLTSYAPNNQSQQTTYNSKLQRVILLNNRLTFLTYFTNKLADKYNTDGIQYNSQVNSLNTNMTTNRTELERQRAKFNSSNMNLEANRRMVEYTQEKNRANNNLLAMYAVLNVAAFAMLVYVART